jgi:hypothetical protein
MAAWRSNPIVGIVAVLLIIVAAFFIWRQIKGPDVIGQMRPIRQYQAEKVGEETAKLVPEGGKCVVIVPEGEIAQDYLDAFKKTAGGSFDVAVFTAKEPAPGPEGQAPEFNPEMMGIVSLLQAVKANPDAKCIVTFIGLSYSPVVAEEGIPPQVTEFFGKGGKGVVLGGDINPIPGQEDPFLQLVKEGKLTLIANKPIVEDPPKKPFDLGPKEFFEKFLTVVRKDNVAEYEKQIKEMMAP